VVDLQQDDGPADHPRVTSVDEIGVGVRRFDPSSEAVRSLTAGRISDPAALIRVVEQLEVAVSWDARAVAEPAAAAVRTAAALGDEVLEWRARLLVADVDRRLGQLEAAARGARDGLAWAQSHDQDLVRARAHRVWSSLLRTVGDLPGALEHAVLAVRWFPEDAAPVRAHHLVGLATVLDESGSTTEALRHYREILDRATAREDWALALLVLNNLAYSEFERGDAVAASEHTARMEEIARRAHVDLDGMELDTVARVQLLLDRPDDAARTLQAVIGDGRSEGLNERTSWADCLLTAVEVHRRLGRDADAQAALDQARRFCETFGLDGHLVQVRLAQAELHARAGRWREAYEEHCRYHAAGEALRSLRREQQAQLMGVMLQVDEARRSSSWSTQRRLGSPVSGSSVARRS